MATPDSAPRQVVVLASGILPTGQLTNASRERSIAAANYYKEFGADNIIFAGGLSALAADQDRPGESLVMAEVAESHGLPGDVISIPRPSRDTVSNIITAAPLVDPDKDLGVLAHRDHLPRGLWIARRILPNTIKSIEVVPASFSHADLAQEALVLGVTKALFAGVPRYDIDAYAKRSQQVLKILDRYHPVISAAVSHVMPNSDPYS